MLSIRGYIENRTATVVCWGNKAKGLFWLFFFLMLLHPPNHIRFYCGERQVQTPALIILIIPPNPHILSVSFCPLSDSNFQLGKSNQKSLSLDTIKSPPETALTCLGSPHHFPDTDASGGMAYLPALLFSVVSKQQQVSSQEILVSFHQSHHRGKTLEPNWLGHTI